MNREQAQHILDAYISMCYAVDADGNSDAKKAKCALREVILDAMTKYKSSTITVPNIIHSQPTSNYVTSDRDYILF